MMNVTFEMEAEQVNAILIQALEDHIVHIHTEFFWHSDDRDYNQKLKEAFWVVFDYFAGKEAAKNFKNSIEGEGNDTRSVD